MSGREWLAVTVLVARWCRLLFAAVAATVLGWYWVLHGAAETEEYDYIVVGGGSTGSVVAGRLGQAGYSVLVLEAGGPTQRSLGGQ